MVTKDEVLSEIRRLAAENGGQTPGRRRFDAETGIRESDWLGRYWARWNDAVAEAGLRPNFLTEARLSDEELVKSVADLTRELGHFPTVAEHRLRRQLGADYPNSSVIQRRLGSRQALLRHLVDFAASHPGYEAVAACCVPLLATEVPEEATDSATRLGYVYLIRMDRWHKIGCSKDILRRRGEIRLTLPAQEHLVHTIETDDPYGVEQYWHRRFAGSRSQGEWFELTPADVRAFKRWRRIY